MHLETERLIIREFSMEDLNDFHEIFGDPDVMKYTEPPYNLKQCKKFLKEFCIEREPKGGFAAELKETGKVIGYILFCSEDDPQIYETGWVFNKDYLRKGYAFEACNCIINYGFYELGLHKITAETTDTEKSVPLMKKLGMLPEGILKKHTKTNEGHRRDLHLYAILGEEYLLVK